MNDVKKYVASIDGLNKEEIEKYNSKIELLNIDNISKLYHLIYSTLPRLIIEDILFSLFKQYFEDECEDLNYNLGIHLMIWLDFLNIRWK